MWDGKSPSIGTMNWQGCEDCRHAEAEGGCAVDSGLWEDELQHDGDFVYCGSYEKDTTA
jgi:hypothetical protein